MLCTTYVSIALSTPINILMLCVRMCRMNLYSQFRHAIFILYGQLSIAQECECVVYLYLHDYVLYMYTHTHSAILPLYAFFTQLYMHTHWHMHIVCQCSLFNSPLIHWTGWRHCTAVCCFWWPCWPSENAVEWMWQFSGWSGQCKCVPFYMQHCLVSAFVKCVSGCDMSPLF